MKLAEAFAPYNERYEKRKKKEASIERLQKQVSKIDISYSTLVNEIAESIKKLIPGSFTHMVYGPFGLMSEMSLSVDALSSGVYVRYNLHFYMRGETLLVTAYDEDGNNPRTVNVDAEDSLEKLIGLMTKSYNY